MVEARKNIPSVLDGEYTVPYTAGMEMARLIRAILDARGWKQADLASRLRTSQVSVSRWLKGAEPRGQKRDAIRALAEQSGITDDTELRRHFIPIMGFVGAGGDVEPDYEQVPFDGLEQIDIPAPLGIVRDPVGFLVRGESQQPRYNDGDIVIVEREQMFDTSSLIGGEAVIRTNDGHRYLKRIMPGPRPNTYDLVALNAPRIEGVRIQWANPVRMVLPNLSRAVRRKERRHPSKRGASAAGERRK